MTLLRLFGYAWVVIVFVFLATQSLSLLNAKSDGLVAVGLGSLLSLLFLGAEFVKYVIHSYKKGETI